GLRLSVWFSVLAISLFGTWAWHAEIDQITRGQASYRVQVKTDSLQFDRNPGQELPLQPGMTATIEVKTGRNTVWSYILKPIVKTLSESLGER
ncbi:MAG: hypothetical protein WBL16_10645, partial [Zwartia sp.]